MLQFDIDILDKDSINTAIERMNKLEKRLKLVLRDYVRISLEWIRDRANELLKQRVYAFPNSTNIAESWEIQQIDNETWKLVNLDERAGYVEFGVGIVGKQTSHNLANEVNYQYDVNGHGEKGWRFYNKELGLYVSGFTGYIGKSFLYDAFYEYQFGGQSEILFTDLLKRAKIL